MGACQTAEKLIVGPRVPFMPLQMVDAENAITRLSDKQAIVQPGATIRNPQVLAAVDSRNALQWRVVPLRTDHLAHVQASTPLQLQNLSLHGYFIQPSDYQLNKSPQQPQQQQQQAQQQQQQQQQQQPTTALSSDKQQTGRLQMLAARDRSLDGMSTSLRIRRISFMTLLFLFK